MYMTIVITWTDQRPEYYGRIRAALWATNGNDADLNAALAHIRNIHDGCVHTFAIDNLNWKCDALAAHVYGGI